MAERQQGTDGFLELVARIERNAAEAEALRAERRQAITALRADGWTLQAIAELVGRSKQTIDQWRRG